MTDAFLALAAVGAFAVLVAVVVWTVGPVGVRRLSMRYLRGTHVTLLGVLGTGVAIAVVLVIKSVVVGLIDEMDKRVRATSADVRLSARFEPGDLEALERRYPDVAAASGTLMPEVGILKTGDDETMAVKTCQVMGLDLARHVRVSDLDRYIELAPGQTVESLQGDWMVAGGDILKNPEVAPGDRVVLQMVYRSDTGWERTRPRYFTIVGVLNTGFYQVDHQTVIIPQAVARELLGPTGGQSIINLRVADGSSTEAVLSQFAPYGPMTYRQEYRQYFMAVDDQGSKLVLMSSVVVIISAVCIFAILVMVTLQKVRDIGIMRAMGASRRAVMGAFLGYALMVGLVGSAAGLGAAGLAIWKIDLLKQGVMKLTGYSPISRKIFTDEKLPADWRGPIGPGRLLPGGDRLPFMLVIPCAAVGLVVVASVLPAWLASRRDPVEAIHYE